MATDGAALSRAAVAAAVDDGDDGADERLITHIVLILILVLVILVLALALVLLVLVLVLILVLVLLFFILADNPSEERSVVLAAQELPGIW